MQAPQDSLELRNLELQLLPDIGVEIVGVEPAAVLHAVVESGVDQLDAELIHQQDDVVINRRDTSGHGYVEGNRAAVILRHVGGNRIPANLVLGFKEAKIKAVRMMMQSPCGTQP